MASNHQTYLSRSSQRTTEAYELFFKIPAVQVSILAMGLKMGKGRKGK